ncbi:MAG TPA: response regulator [Candidatus Saccharimonadales bacterium]|nr:response regulator [Candidatus Saccharimonadales bacterium]
MAHILLIESDRMLAANIGAALTRAGHNVVHTADAQAAITAADAHAPDIIILDLMLAGRSGIEFLYELRSYSDWCDIPVLVYSNIHATDLPEGCLEELGVAGVFYKPTTRPNDLVAAAANLQSLATSQQ